MQILLVISAIRRMGPDRFAREIANAAIWRDPKPRISRGLFAAQGEMLARFQDAKQPGNHLTHAPARSAPPQPPDRSMPARFFDTGWPDQLRWASQTPHTGRRTLVQVRRAREINVSAANISHSATIHIFGRIHARDFPDWILRHARKLDLHGVVIKAFPDCLMVQASGPDEMLKALELGCSLGPATVLVERVNCAVSNVA